MRFFIAIFFVGVVLNLSAGNLFSADPELNIENKSNEDIFIVIDNPMIDGMKLAVAGGYYETSIQRNAPTKIFLYKKKKSGFSWDKLSEKLQGLFQSQKGKYDNFEPLCSITFTKRVHASSNVGQSVTFPRTIYIKYKSTGDKSVVAPQEGYGIAGSLRWTKQKYNLGNNVRPEEMIVNCVTDKQK